MKTRISDRLRELVSVRANFRCEYCLLHRDDEPIYSHEVDHVIVEKHLGLTAANILSHSQLQAE